MMLDLLATLVQYGALGVVAALLGLKALVPTYTLQDHLRRGTVPVQTERDIPFGYKFFRRMPFPIWERWLQRQLGDGR